MRFRHIKPDHIYQGLPAGEIDDDQLNVEQQALLAAAVNAGVYEPIHPAPARRTKKESANEPGKEN